VGAGKASGTTAEAVAEADAISAGSVERLALSAGWLATCRFDVPAWGVGRRASAGRVGVGKTEGMTAETVAEAGPISAGTVERVALGAGWLATCRFDVPAGGVGRRVSAGRVGVGKASGMTAETVAGADAISAGSEERLAPGAGWLATCGFDVPAWGVGRRVSAGRVGVGKTEGTMAEAVAEADAVAAGSVERLGLGAGWLATCGFDVPAWGVGRRVSAGRVGVGQTEGTMAEAAAEADAVAGGSVERLAPGAGWLATCRFDVPAWGVGRRASAGRVGVGQTEGTMAEAAAEADAISAASVERSSPGAGWLATCGFDVPAGGVGRRVSAGRVGVGQTEGTMAEAAAEADAVAAGSVERTVFCAGFARVATALSCAGWLGSAAGITVGGADSAACSGTLLEAVVFSGMPDSSLLRLRSFVAVARVAALFASGAAETVTASVGVGLAEAFWATGWLATCGFDVPAGSVGRRASAGRVTVLGRVRICGACAGC
jgi:hypothetical protein